MVSLMLSKIPNGYTGSAGQPSDSLGQEHEVHVFTSLSHHTHTHKKPLRLGGLKFTTQ